MWRKGPFNKYLKYHRDNLCWMRTNYKMFQPSMLSPSTWVINLRWKTLDIKCCQWVFYYSKLIVTVINVGCTDCSTLISHWHQSYWCAWLFVPAFNKLCISYDNSGLFDKSSQLPRVINTALLNLTFKVLVFSTTTQWFPSVTLLTKSSNVCVLPCKCGDFRLPIFSNPEFFYEVPSSKE